MTDQERAAFLAQPQQFTHAGRRYQVVLRPQRLVSAAAISEWASQRLGKLQRLAAVEVREELPRGGLGKVLKRQLREEFEATQRLDGK